MTDKNGEEIKIGDYLKVKESYQTYQLRERGGMLVLHSGACYREAREDEVKTLAKVSAIDNVSFLGIGADLFKNNLQ